MLNPNKAFATSTAHAEQLEATDLVEHLDQGDNVIALHTPFEPRNFNRVLSWYLPADMLAMAGGFVVAWAIAALLNVTFMQRDALLTVSMHDPLRLIQYMAIAAGCLLWFQHTEHYRMRMPFWQEVRKVMSTMGFALMADGFLQFASKQDVSRLWVMSAWLGAAAGIVVLRACTRAWLRRTGKFQVPTLLIGSGDTAQHTQAALQSEQGLGYNIVAQIDDLPRAFRQAGRSWKRLFAQYGVEYAVIALDGHAMAEAEQPIAQLMRDHVPFSVSPPLRHLPVQGMVPQYFFNHDTMLLTHSCGLEQPLPRFLKRAVDIAAAGTALLLLSPLLLLLGALVKMDGGPALFGHSRLGRNGKSFPCFKFRSMVTKGDEVLARHLSENPEAQAEWEETRKLVNDPRVTKVGDFLRRSSLDELPQLLNVLRGEMSLVGPRPIVTAEVDKYDRDIAHYYRVRPGITGLWQVSGRSDVSYPQRVQMDSWYVRNWSFWHDIAILCKTFPALMKRSGAY